MFDSVDWTESGIYWGIAAGVAGVAAFAWLCAAMFAGWRAHRARRATAAGLAILRVEAGDLLDAVDRGELPSVPHDAWVARAEEFLRSRLGAAYVQKFGDFSGIMYFGDLSPRSKLRNDIQGRSQRLNEFDAELRERR